MGTGRRTTLSGKTVPADRWIVYKLMWPSGWWYIGYTGQPLSQRIRQHRTKGTVYVRERFAAEGRPQVEVLGEFTSQDRAVAHESALLADAEEFGDWVHSLNGRVT